MFKINMYNAIIVLCLVLLPFSKCYEDSHDGVGDFFDGRSEIFSGRILLEILKNFPERSDEQDEICRQDLELQNEAFYRTDLWAMEMVDAAGKEPYSVITGNWNSFGQKQQCLSIKHTDETSSRNIRGKYCIGHLPIPALIRSKIVEKYNFQNFIRSSSNSDVNDRVINTVNQTFIFNLGLCVPESCSADLVQEYLQDAWNNYPLSEGNVMVPESLCEIDEIQPWETLEIVVLAFFLCYGVMVVISTGYDVWFIFYRKDDGSKEKHELKRAFSMYSNAKKLTTFGNDPGPLGCLHGIRALSIMWIVLGHRYNHRQWMAMENYFDIYTWGETYEGMLILASTVSVDSFFVMSGILLSYVFFRLKSADGFFKTLPMFYIHRYIRLTPVVALVVLFYAGLSGRMFFGPLREYFVRTMQEYCRINWWTNLLYVQNFVDTHRICVSQTWYLTIDMQLYIISPLILYPLLKKPKVGLILLSLWILVSQALTFYIAYEGRWWGGMMTSDPAEETFRSLFYVPTYTRATPWLLGVLIGYILKKSMDKKKAGGAEEQLTSRQLNIRRLINVIGWLISLALMSAVLFGMKPLQALDHEFNLWEDTTYLAFNRTAWSIALLWVVCSCFYGYGGPVTWLLCLKPFQFIGRISYSLYLIHKLIQSTQVSLITHVSRYEHFTIAYEFLGDIVSCTAVAIIMVLMFESPILILEKKLLHGGDKPKPKIETTVAPEVDRKEALQDVQVEKS